jgi:hypothetical protein
MAKNKEKLGGLLKDARRLIHPIIVHELGHWTMAKKVSFETGNLRIKVGRQKDRDWAEGSATIILQMPLKSINDTIEYLDKRIAVLCAGAHAESLIVCPSGVDIPNHFEHVLHTNGNSDYQKADELAALARNILHAESLDPSEEALERWQQIVRAMEKYQFTVSEIERLKQRSLDFVEDILEKMRQGIGPEYIFHKSRLDELFVD